MVLRPRIEFAGAIYHVISRKEMWGQTQLFSLVKYHKNGNRLTTGSAGSPINPAPGDLSVEAVEKTTFRKFAVNKIKRLGVRKKPNSIFL